MNDPFWYRAGMTSTHPAKASGAHDPPPGGCIPRLWFSDYIKGAAGSGGADWDGRWSHTPKALIIFPRMEAPTGQAYNPCRGFLFNQTMYLGEDQANAVARTRPRFRPRITGLVLSHCSRSP